MKRGEQSHHRRSSTYSNGWSKQQQQQQQQQQQPDQLSVGYEEDSKSAVRDGTDAMTTPLLSNGTHHVQYPHQRHQYNYHLHPNSSSSSTTAMSNMTNETLANPLPMVAHKTPPSSNHYNGSHTILSTSNASSSASSSSTAIPGKPRRKLHSLPLDVTATTATSSNTRLSSSSSSSSKRRPKNACDRFYIRWIKQPIMAVSSFSSILMAVLLWYILGVASIGTSKLLLTGGGGGGSTTNNNNNTNHHNHHHGINFGGIPPLFLTLQQLFIGSTLLRFLLKLGFMGSTGLQPWPSSSSSNSSTSSSIGNSVTTTTIHNGISPILSRGKKGYHSHSSHHPKRSSFHTRQQHRTATSLQRLLRYLTLLLSYPNIHLVLSGIYFSLGFFVTNYSFQQSSAAFVETVKAAEPITSAAVAVAWGIETLSRQELISLLGIVTGVLLSTLANNNNGSDGTTNNGMVDSLKCCWVVMTANLFFSFRGLQQKLFRASSYGSPQVVDDLNLQYRMQQIGVSILLLPVLIVEVPTLLSRISTLSSHVGLIRSGMLQQYVGLALVNGFAFASYNLASTYILSRISVVHHAALNCVRRIFAIIVTSIVFGIPITFTGAIGIAISFVGFMSFSHYKAQRQRQPKRLSSLLPSACGTLPTTTTSTTTTNFSYGVVNAV